jgi:hypothetical protein
MKEEITHFLFKSNVSAISNVQQDKIIVGLANGQVGLFYIDQAFFKNLKGNSFLGKVTGVEWTDVNTAVVITAEGIIWLCDFSEGEDRIRDKQVNVRLPPFQLTGVAVCPLKR